MRLLAAPVAAAFAALAIGCDDERTVAVSLVRVELADEGCGAPPDARTLIVTALGEHSPSGATALAPDLAAGGSLRIPGSTRVIAVEVLGAAGVLRAVGRTAPFSVGDLDEGDALAVATAPPRGFCPVPSPGRARLAPLAAPAAGGVLVAGGRDGGGEPVRSVHWYDPAGGAFEDLGEPLYGGPDFGLVGATMTALDDGRVVVAGGAQPAYQVFDPATRAMDSALFLDDERAHHAAVALGGGRILLAGGCGALAAGGGCDGGTLRESSVILDVDRGEVTPGPDLAAPRVGGIAIREPDGRVVLLGGTDGEGERHAGAERLDPAAGAAEAVDGVAAVAAAQTVSGSAVAIAEGGAIAALPPGESTATTLGGAALPVGATATALEDGRVFVAGGGAAGLVAPGTGRIADLGDEPGAAIAAARVDHAAVMLPDGAVLLVGGRDGEGAPRGDAWLFRPDLTGPYTSGAAIAFGSRDLAEQVIPRDPARAEIRAASADVPAHLLLESSGDDGGPSEWAIVAGPRFAAPKLEARLGADDGAYVLLAFRDPARRWEIGLREGEAPELWQIDDGGGVRARSCTSAPVPDGALGDRARTEPISVEVSGAGLSVRAGGEDVLGCPELREVPFGFIGLAPRGPDGAAVRVDSILVER